MSLLSQKPINPPSIPSDNLGYKYTQDNKIQKVLFKQKKAEEENEDKLKISRARGLSWNHNQTISRKEDEAVLPGPGSYNVAKKNQKVKAPTSCFDSQIDRFNPKKIKRTFQPGPGDYNVEDRQLRQFSQTHFNSKSVRFPIDKKSTVGPGSYNMNHQASLKTFNKTQSEKMNIQANRKTIFSTNLSKNPGPGQYIARDGMTFQLQKALLRKHNLSQFPNSKRQVFEPKDDDYFEPGPGSYQANALKTYPKGSIGYKKTDVINLKQDQLVDTPSPFQYNLGNLTMAKQIEKQSKRLRLTQKKPFNSGSERFSHYTQQKFQNQRTNTYDTENTQMFDPEKSTRINFQGPKRVKKLIMTTVKVKVPFGSSTKKIPQNESNDVGPGYYNSENNWIKQSHSIKNKLNQKKFN